MRSGRERRMAAVVGMVAVGFVLFTASGAALGQDLTKINEAALRAKVAQFIADWERGAGMQPGTPQKAIQFVDLNSDGRPEALTVLQGLDHCGVRGCTAFVLDLTNAKARSIGDFIAVSLKPLASKTNGWQDLSVNDHRVIFANGKYVPAGR